LKVNKRHYPKRILLELIEFISSLGDPTSSVNAMTIN
jgi:hypothetical protein